MDKPPVVEFETRDRSIPKAGNMWNGGPKEAPEGSIVLQRVRDGKQRVRTRTSDCLRKIPGAHAALREAQVLKAWSEGRPVAEIARRLDLSPKQVMRYLEGALRRDIPAEKVEQWRSGMVACCKSVMRKSEKQWRRSCQDEVTITRTTNSEGKEEVKETRKGQSGNPAHQRNYLAAVQRICALLGLDAPKRVEIQEGRTLEIIETVVRSREEAQQLLAIDVEFEKKEPSGEEAGQTDSGIDAPEAGAVLGQPETL